MQTNLATMEEHDCMDTLNGVGDSQLSCSADTESESNSCSSSSSTKTVTQLVCLIAYSINIHTYFNASCMRKFQEKQIITRIIGDHFGN